MLREHVLRRIKIAQKSKSHTNAEESKDRVVDVTPIVRTALDETRVHFRQCMEQKRQYSNNSTSRAEYDEKTKTIIVSKFSGKLIKNMGYSMAGKRLLYPEEALFLIEAACLELLHNGIPLSLSQAYALLLGNDVSWNRYCIYCHLIRASYTAVRYRGPQPIADQHEENSETSSTSAASSNRQKFSIAYDVHLSDSGYSMTKEQKPDHRILIMEPHEPALTLDELISLKSILPDDVPLHVGVAEDSDIIFYRFTWGITPDLESRPHAGGWDTWLRETVK